MTALPHSTLVDEPRADPEPAADRRQRILIGADTYHPDVNGAAYFGYRLAAGLAARGHDVHVVCPSPTGPFEVGVDDGVTVHRLRSVRTPVHPTFRVSPPPLVGPATRRVLEAVRPDVVHVQSHFLVGRALLRAATQAAVPSLATNHFMPDNLMAYAHVPAAARRMVCALAWRDFARVFATADQVTTPTPIAADLIQGKGLAAPVSAISCGIDLERFRPREGGGQAAAELGLPARPTLLFVGRLDAEKRLWELVSALPVIRRAVDAQLVLVGIGSQESQLRRMADRLGVTEHVYWLGFVPDQRLPAVYAAADVFCMPGTAELQSLVTLEAMASGLPVIAADAMALPHLVRPGVNGYLYRPGDLETLAQYASELLSEPATRDRMGRASRALASRHGLDRTLAAFEQLYASLVGTASDGRRLAGYRDGVPFTCP